MADDTVGSEPVSPFSLKNREKTGKFREFGCPKRRRSRKGRVMPVAYAGFSLRSRTGNSREQISDLEGGLEGIH